MHKSIQGVVYSGGKPVQETGQAGPGWKAKILGRGLITSMVL